MVIFSGGSLVVVTLIFIAAAVDLIKGFIDAVDPNAASEPEGSPAALVAATLVTLVLAVGTASGAYQLLF